MSSYDSHQHNFWRLSIVIILLVALSGGCIGLMNPMKLRMSAQSAVDEGFEGAPDNCTKCHYAWAERFEYYRGWDRYGYIYGTEKVVGAYDPWYTPSIVNTFEKYYTGDWWDTPEINAWPDDIIENAASLSVLARGGLPKIPGGLEDITGPVIVVAKEGGDYTSIRKAVKKAEAGTTVFVRRGEYNECIVLKDGVNLIGEDPYTTIVNPLNQGHAVVAANNSLIANFTFTGTGINYATRAFNTAVYVSGCDSTCVIASNIFRENGLFGVWIDGTPEKDANKSIDKTIGNRQVEMVDRPYIDYPNPIIVGNTFYRIGQRGVFCVHARGEIFNNIFAGNVKAVGLERHSRPLFHHNVCYFNNIPMAINRSEPVVFNNIMLRNQWGQRMLRGANPVIFNNVTWNSPFFRDFDENGLAIPYPGLLANNNIELDPKFTDPLDGDFSFSGTSPLWNATTGFDAMGIMRDADLPQPLTVQCQNSYGREVLSMNPPIVALIETIAAENVKIKSVEAAYSITYESYLDIAPDKFGDPDTFDLTPYDSPAVRVEYTVPYWSLKGVRREKTYRETSTSNGATARDAGKIVYNGNFLTAESGRFASLYNSEPDRAFVGERALREAPGGFYRDYDQFYRGAMGPTGTFPEGYMRIMGGRIAPDTIDVDGHPCIAVRYPHIGKDQYIVYYLDPAIGHRPRKMELYFNEKLYRTADSYEYREFADGIHLPIRATITDFAVRGELTGKKVAECKLVVDSAKVNGK